MSDIDKRLEDAVRTYVDDLDVDTGLELRAVRHHGKRLTLRRRIVTSVAAMAAVGAAVVVIGAPPQLFEGDRGEVLSGPRRIALLELTPKLSMDVEGLNPAFVVVDRAPGYVSLRWNEGDVAVTFANPDGVFESVEAASAEQRAPMPENVHGFILEHPGIRSSTRAGIAQPVGPFPASYLDLDLTETVPGACTDPCLPLFAVGDRIVSLHDQSRHRLFIANAQDTRLVVVVEAAPENFQAATRAADSLLARVRVAE